MMNANAIPSRITAIGTYVPSGVLRNADLEKMVETSDEWILQRTGIHERRIAAKDEFTSDLAIAAVENMAAAYGKNLTDVDLILVATSTPDFPFPSVASQIQAHFGIAQAGAMDLSATCAGFTYALHTANAMIASGLHRKVLVVAAETLSKVTDYTDRTTCILFGDGAGAVLVEADPDAPGFHAAYLGSKGDGGIHVYRSGLSTSMDGRELAGNGCIVQNGREVYKWAVTTVPTGMQEVASRAGIALDEVDWFIPHSANLRMIESICERSGFPLEKTLYSLAYYGNTSAATIPLALGLGIEQGKVKAGDKILLYGFGGGLVHAGLLLTWQP
ncbi:3-oxoacyl-[acyl-carrier-protein] synthase 3 protein 2 [Brevibacillus agri]|uniref:Beta-ketoacyl-[acyl-carrier-protein] synthase III n=1 Tax=Brevibacillus agri TaxID=51101 RepID=A0A3M8AUA0_9BACL|nr:MULTISPECIES: ketoacyl-ACP synthase III [Brevibacillus]ELK41043.1 3-oxoacyl-(acyl carrier protein) synthase III [Brevibacillus agri BAB-2500]MBY0053274.1 ketoacyl-ACP synthase III [Brevibacillus agri]MDN4092562.1 ketoacyl-ACP synthase III [Brevibacillus agri]MDR9503622.1 ketoacyl-ACP synthase III [Brevibacillus agri]MED1645846.1 ketoacyl-ACP synthase III [Brevibacillus agri]